MQRRDFIKNMILGAGSFSPLMKIGGGLAVSSQFALANSSFEDYKALVVLFLDGGNDAMNMFVPTKENTHAQYLSIRGTNSNIGLGISKADLSNTDFTSDSNGYYVKNASTNHPYYDEPQSDDGLSSSFIRSYAKGTYHINNKTTNEASGLGINSMMPELFSMYKQGKVAVISNVGTLVEPTTKEMIDNGTAKLPLFLFAHNHQKRAVYTAKADELIGTGWAGRIADSWGINSPVGLNLSYAGITRMQIGNSTTVLNMPTDTPVSFKTSYTQNADSFEKLLTRFDNISNTNAFSEYYSKKVKNAGDLSTLLIDSLKNAPDFSTFSSKNTYGQNLFTVPNMESDVGIVTHDDIRDNIFKQFEAVAKMIKVGRDTLNYKRQIFYIRLGGFDTHSLQATEQGNHFRSISIAISDFQKALEEMNIDKEVATISLSEFGRTLKPNSNGTDHGWAGHSFIVSNADEFNGGNVFGTVLDDLSLEGKNAYTQKGRLIPTTSIEQMLAPTLKWFGVDNSLIKEALPNLENFKKDDSLESAFLGGVFSV